MTNTDALPPTWAGRRREPRVLLRGLAAGVMALAIASTSTITAWGAAPDPTPSSTDSAAGASALLLSVRTQSWIAPGQSQSFFGAVLRAIGAPVTPANLRVMEAWARSEGSRSAYNPWNTTQRAPGSHVDSNGSTSFASADSAVAALTRQLLSLYRSVVAGFAASDPNQTIAAIVASPWASSHYGGQSNYQSSLIWRVYVGLPGSGSTPGAPVVSVPAAVPVLRLRTGVGTATLRWATTSDNGSAIKQFQVAIRQRNPAAHQWRGWRTKTLRRMLRQTTWTNLVVGQRYQMRVRARNSVGYGPWSKRFAALL